MLEYDDQELALVITSLGITYDAYVRKAERVTGHRHQTTLDDIEVCDRALTKSKAEHMRRLRTGERVWPIGTPE